MRSWARVAQWNPVDEWEGGFGWSQQEFMRRTSHALVVASRVWLIDPVDTPDLEERVRTLGEPAGVLQLLDRHARGCAVWAGRLGVPHLRAWESVGESPFEPLRVRSRRWWREVIGLHPLLRPFPPRTLGRVAPRRILCGHGEGVFEGAADALHEALQTGRRRLPAALLGATKAGLHPAGR